MAPAVRTVVGGGWRRWRVGGGYETRLGNLRRPPAEAGLVLWLRTSLPSPAGAAVPSTRGRVRGRSLCRRLWLLFSASVHLLLAAHLLAASAKRPDAAHSKHTSRRSS